MGDIIAARFRYDSNLVEGGRKERGKDSKLNCVKYKACRPNTA